MYFLRECRKLAEQPPYQLRILGSSLRSAKATVYNLRHICCLSEHFCLRSRASCKGCLIALFLDFRELYGRETNLALHTETSLIPKYDLTPPCKKINSSSSMIVGLGNKLDVLGSNWLEVKLFYWNITAFFPCI